MKQKTRLEKNFQASVQKRLKTLPDTWFYKASDRVRSGIPDIILCVGGIFVAMELKRTEHDKATPLQKHTLELIDKSGGYAWVVNPSNWEEIWLTLSNLAKGGAIPS